MIIFFGENGSNAVNLINLKMPIKAGITNKENSKALKFFKENNIKTFIIKDHNNLEEILNSIEHKLIVMVGYMKILPINITSKYKIVNLHPSLLPEHKGINAFENSFLSKTGTGITLHWVNEDLDEGEIIFQEKLNYEGLNFNTAKSLLKYYEYLKLPEWIHLLYKEL